MADRFALVGDAAHGVHPIAGQGLNLGLRDVAALTEVVADAARLGLDIGSLTVLERYERWRRLDSALSAATFDALNRLFSNDSTLLRTARDFGLGLVERMPALKQLFVAEAAGLTGEVPKLLRGERGVGWVKRSADPTQAANSKMRWVIPSLRWGRPNLRAARQRSTLLLFFAVAGRRQRHHDAAGGDVDLGHRAHR